MFAIPADEIKDAKVILTIMDGQVTFESVARTYEEENYSSDTNHKTGRRICGNAGLFPVY